MSEKLKVIYGHTPPFDTVKEPTMSAENWNNVSLDDVKTEEWDRVNYQYTFEPFEYPSGSIDIQPSVNFYSDDVISSKIDYKYNEGRLIEEFLEYVDSTYSQHYSQNKYQATEFIIDGGHGEGFCIGNVLKYAQRYGKKGDTPAEWRKDIMKVLHYALIQLYIHDTKYEGK